MLSVRLPPALEAQLAQFCESAHLSKSAVVQQALESHLKTQRRRQATIDPIDALVGSAPRVISTDEWMRQTRGDDWGQP